MINPKYYFVISSIIYPLANVNEHTDAAPRSFKTFAAWYKVDPVV